MYICHRTIWQHLLTTHNFMEVRIFFWLMYHLCYIVYLDCVLWSVSNEQIFKTRVHIFCMPIAYLPFVISNTTLNVNVSLVFCVMFCRSLFILLYFFCWPLYCLFFFDLRLLIAPLLNRIKPRYSEQFKEGSESC